MRDFRKLKVWEKAHLFALDVYEISKSFPSDEKYGLTSQIRRAVLSVPTNISEGCGHNSNKEFVRFLQISAASTSEVEYLLLFAKDLELVTETKYEDLNHTVTEIKKMLYSLIEINKAKNSRYRNA